MFSSPEEASNGTEMGVEVTTYIEWLILGATIENVLVAAHVPPHTVKGLDHLQPQAFALMLLGDGDLFHVADEAAAMDTSGTTRYQFRSPTMVFLPLPQRQPALNGCGLREEGGARLFFFFFRP